MSLVLEAKRWSQASHFMGMQGTDPVDHADAAPGLVHHETPSCEAVEVGREFEGAAASCSGGESTQVGDRPRSQEGHPESSDVGVRGRERIGIGGDEFRDDPWSLTGRPSHAAVRRVRNR